MSDLGLFLGKFLRHGTAIASLAPSSRWLSRAAVKNVDWQRAKVLIELGGGTGPITKVLAEKARDNCRVVVVERDPDFCRILHERYSHKPNFHIVEADVCNIDKILEDLGIGYADHVISGLPIPSFPLALQKDVFRSVKRVLAPHGAFNQLSEIPGAFHHVYRRYFHEVKFVFEPRNLPPGGVYICKGTKDIG